MGAIEGFLEKLEQRGEELIEARDGAKEGQTSFRSVLAGFAETVGSAAFIDFSKDFKPRLKLPFFQSVAKKVSVGTALEEAVREKRIATGRTIGEKKGGRQELPYRPSV